CQQYDSRPYSF
nr:immunoglobulin light chain junction region [Macaca mulatta]MOX86002.1 immunoglobulin light chain junction region [Macaca mulatta]MOX86074.1 immunoglobulin light chain junction region [Macaca mulatta]MOX86911.1 immunoglobulin light chain junction region [Macaca mulatta]MOX86945.1 immunoglobulin light chain junction region [Macaca mulatta]